MALQNHTGDISESASGSDRPMSDPLAVFEKILIAVVIVAFGVNVGIYGLGYLPDVFIG